MNVYVDLSGSMFEMGGKNALEYVLKSLKDYCEFKGIECNFYDFEGKKIDIFNLSPKISKLVDLKENLKEGFNVVISDGYFENKIKLDVYSIAFSAGSNIRVLEYISKEVFDEAEIIKLVEYYMCSKEVEDEW